MRDTILIVDDVEINRDMLEGMLENDYRIVSAESGREALEIINEHHDRLLAVLLDLVMPEIDGYQVLGEMEKKGYLQQIPVLVISTEDSLVMQKECFRCGVSDFIHKPFDQDMVRVRVDNIVNLYMYKQHLEDTVEQQVREINAFNANVVEMLGNVVETRSLESGAHVRRVKSFTGLLAEAMMRKYPKYGLSKETIDVIVSAAALHDVGKVAIPDSIMLKPGKLTADEFEIMKTHSELGSELIRNMDGMWDEQYARISYEICRHHHEKYDGKGYPDHLMGDEIPISAQLVSIADVYDALTSKRCYKDAYEKQKAYDMILNGECGQFSPELLDCLAECKSDFEALAEKLMDKN